MHWKGISPGTPIAVVAPSSAFSSRKAEDGFAIAREHGHHLVPFPETTRHRTFAAPDEVRRAHLTEALTLPDFGAVWAIRGGYGVTRLLPTLPWQDIKPRPVIGFSDLTPLLEAMRVRKGVSCLHGPVLHSLSATSEDTRAQFFSTLAGTSLPHPTGETWVSGQATGPLVGGNLSMILATVGTPWACQLDGAILFLEDIAEAPYRIDRMLTQLRQSGALSHVAGIALGSFEGCHPPADAGYTLEEILREHLCDLGVPVLAKLPFGHGSDNIGLPVGVTAQLKDGMLGWPSQHMG